MFLKYGYTIRHIFEHVNTFCLRFLKCCVFCERWTNMYSIFEQLLQKYGVSTYRVSKETGIAQSVFSSWKNGISTPKQDKLKKIADYFTVSVEYLMTGEEKEADRYYINEETAQVAQEIFENKELRALFDVQRGMSAEDLQALHGMALALKRKERGGNDDTGC